MTPSDDYGSGTRLFGFDCSGCGETTIVEAESPAALESRIYSCSGCDENILMDNYVGDR